MDESWYPMKHQMKTRRVLLSKTLVCLYQNYNNKSKNLNIAVLLLSTYYNTDRFYITLSYL